MNPYEPPNPIQTTVRSIRVVAIAIARAFGVPMMFVLYLGMIIPLSVVYAMDWAFDAVGNACGFDTRFWPLPKGQDEDFLFRQRRRDQVAESFVSVPGADETQEGQ